jgi:2'-hydroxyisoflavone reductase
MKILIIGGTKFLGRHLIAAAQARGHEVTLFNRGRYSSENFAGVEQIRGDRHGDLDRLSGRTWDAAIDTCGYLPQSLKMSAEALKDAVNQYVFISSISAYAGFSEPDFDETAPAAELNEEQLERVAAVDLKGDFSAVALGEMYGGLKVLCEREAEKAMPGRVLHVRAGLIVGSFDPTDRFTYWVMRVARGGEVLAPGSPGRFVQFIHVRDLSDWIVKAVEQNAAGIYNVTSKPFELTMQMMLEEIKNTSGSDAHFTWVSEEFMNRETVGAWGEMPLYLPESAEEMKGFLAVNVDKALKIGLEFRPLRDTVQDTLAWRKTKPDEPLRAGLDSEREKELLRKWREQQ